MLEKEVIEARTKALELTSENAKLHKEVFLLQEELKNELGNIKLLKTEVKDYKAQLHLIQHISADLAAELHCALSEVKYWYNQHSPTLKTVIYMYIRSLKDAYNNFKRFKTFIR